MDRKLYVSYGSNLNISKMKYRCPDAFIIGKGYIEDYELEFRRVANIAEHKGQKVPIVVWRISERDEKALDRYEGISVGHYRKETIKVKIDTFSELVNVLEESILPEEVYAMVYIMNVENRPIEQPDPSYYHEIYIGYRDHNLEIRSLAVAAIKCDMKFPEYMAMEKYYYGIEGRG